MCFNFGKGISSGLSSRSQDFTISGCPLACVCSPLAFIFQQLTGSKAEGKGHSEWQTRSVLSQGSLKEQVQLFTLQVWFPEFASLVWRTRRVVQWLCSWLEVTEATQIRSGDSSPLPSELKQIVRWCSADLINDPNQLAWSISLPEPVKQWKQETCVSWISVLPWCQQT